MQRPRYRDNKAQTCGICMVYFYVVLYYSHEEYAGSADTNLRLSPSPLSAPLLCTFVKNTLVNNDLYRCIPSMDWIMLIVDIISSRVTAFSCFKQFMLHVMYCCASLGGEGFWQFLSPYLRSTLCVPEYSTSVPISKSFKPIRRLT